MKEMPDFSPEIRENGAEKREYGRNVNVSIEFGRHENPGKTPEGMSADFLTEVGQKRALERGGKITERNVAGYSSPKLRAQDTVDLELSNTADDVTVINQTIRSLRGNDAVDLDGQNPENMFRIKTKQELDTTKNFAAIFGEAKAWAQAEIESGSKRTAYDLIVQYYLDNTERCEELGITTPHEAATEIAYRAARELDMPSRFYSGTEIRLVNITHGPKLEPFLKEVLINKDGSRGFQSLDEIGGALNEGESFQFKVERDEDGNQKVALILRDQEYEVDQEAIKLLHREYLDKILSEQSSNK